ncbi:hypothetical protein ACE2AJ_09195 [Aquihabitans daechungensis]|uniref:hypothetical protein n=1 Tax=Aquihabitans daechungensis TaxID=1052257 RepID=UPI003BA1F1FD
MGRAMCSHGPTPPPDRRVERGLQYDPATGELSLGSTTSVVPAGASNRVVLIAYVDLAAHSRGRSVAELIEVRQGDVEALARALDLDAADLAQEIEEVLGATRAEAIRLVSRLRESRVIGGITKAATAGMVAGSLLAGSAGMAAATPPSSDPVTELGMIPVIGGPLSVDADAVGLIPPVSEDSEGVVLIPPASIDRDDQAGS